MTTVLVSDTSILIDLERGRLLEVAFGLSYEFVVPDLLYKQELREENGEALIALGLTVAELEPAQATMAQDYHGRTSSRISLPDAFALALAKAHGYVLLTGDQQLRGLAEEESVDCHGVLWVLDQMYHQGAATFDVLYDGLTAIAAHPRCRLPKAEVKVRRTQWANAAGIPIDD